MNSSTFLLDLKENYYEAAVNLTRSVRLITDYVGFTIICLGLLGNFVGFVVLCRSREMQTAHFVYYKALTFAECLYCMNYFATKFVTTFQIQMNAYGSFYTSYTGAWIERKLCRLISSSTGYVGLYVSIVIIIDRVIALARLSPPTAAEKIRKTKIAIVIVIAVVFVAICVNSWATAFETILKEWSCDVPTNDMTGARNVTCFEAVPREGPNSYQLGKTIKDGYNFTIRISYSVLLIVLSIILVILHRRYHRQKNQVTNSTRANQRRDNLYGLLFIIVILAFIQVAPAEARRIYRSRLTDADRMSQMDEGFKNSKTFSSFKLSVDYYFADRWLLMLSNFTTYMDRSFKFYLYIMFNHIFRGEFIKLIRCRRYAETSWV